MRNQPQHSHRLQQAHPNQDEAMSSTWTNARDWESTSSKDRALENLLFKFGTDMPTTIDLQSAVDCCDMLCRFALQYFSQAAGDNSYMDIPAPLGDEETEALERANLQVIRNLSSTMLIGLQHSGRGTDGASGSGIEDPLLQAAIDRDMDHDGEERGPRFGPGPATNEMRHELAKSAAAIFQLAIRIKAWVNMTPAQRVLDEEINIIRGKRCLFMDGTTTIPMPAVDAQHQHRHAKDWALAYTRAHTTLQGSHGRGGQDQSERDYPIKDRHHPTQHGSSSMRTEGGPTMASSSSSRVIDQGIMMARHRPVGVADTTANSGGGSSASSGSGVGSGGPGFKSAGPDRGENPSHQKYRKRAKRTHPPGRCLSCDTSDTPEWRRGPDGARTLCNACGLHYAKLRKREQQQILQGQEQEQIQLQIPIFSQFSQRTLPPARGSTGPVSGVGEGAGGAQNNNEDIDEELGVTVGSNGGSSSSSGYNNNAGVMATSGPEPMDQDGHAGSSSSSLSSHPRQHHQPSSSTRTGSSSSSSSSTVNFQPQQELVLQHQQHDLHQPQTQQMPQEMDKG
ncbi:hypothetical protein BGZ95_009673 [Linnemannia exigua]|uniref:GATA-type domain-containing protein n=1 Tax=Linnemannia exigua TaxID=604196 RepID=A0AAD4DM08_9FUNG|nr:hypothetical protein BGZ95_009673 [Linnemannia exigua]